MVIHYLWKYFVQWFKDEFHKAPLRGTQRGLASEFPSKNEKKKIKKKGKHSLYHAFRYERNKILIKVEANIYNGGSY